MKSKKSLYFITALALFVGALHFIIGPNYHGILASFSHSYLIDILLPMVIYLLFQVAARKRYSIRKSRVYGATITFFIALIIENLQFAGIHVFGNTWDSMDIVSYLAGILFALLLDLLLIDKWEKQEGK